MLEEDWVIDLDYAAFFDSIDHELMLKAVAAHTDERWVLLYVERWLKAPLDDGSDTLVARDRGTPQGSAISPVLANIYLHYSFDMWMAREFPAVPFERYADDAVVHCKSERQARFVLGKIKARMADCQLELSADKTLIVYCKDSNRKGSYEHERFDFLGFMFRPRKARNGQGKLFTSFLPAVSDDAAKKIRHTIRRWRIHLWSGTPLTEIAREINQTVRGWVNYYGRFYPSRLAESLRRIDEYLVRWAMRKYKRLKMPPQAGLEVPGRRVRTRARALCSLASGTSQRPDGGSRMSERLSRTVLREPGAATPRATHLSSSGRGLTERVGDSLAIYLTGGWRRATFFGWVPRLLE